MNPSTLSVLLLLQAVASCGSWYVRYPRPFCVVEGSTTTIPCSFNPEFSKKVEVRVKRVVWCSNDYVCKGNVPIVYDSSNVLSDSRFQYLGDLTRNCTLKIMNTAKGDAAIYRFRFETNVDQWTETSGVHIRVTDGEDVIITSSIRESEVRRGGQVTLTCSSPCSAHQLDVLWCRNGLALSETGPALHLSNLTCHHTGNYTCSMDSSRMRTSAPWSLVVEGEDGEDVIITSSIRESEVRRGGQVTLTCSSPCSAHQLDVLWCRNGLALSETGPALHLSNLTCHHTGNYTCSMDSSRMRTSAPWSLVVEGEDGEDVIITSSIRQSEVRRGGQVTLTCSSPCSSHQLDVLWCRNGLALSETGPALHLSNLTCHHTGNYTCSMDSSRMRTSAPWSLVVEDEDGEDVIITSSIRESEVRRGGQVTLTCSSPCSAHQLDVLWCRNGLALSETGPAFHLSNLTCHHTGNYTCSMDSSRMRTSAPWSLVVEDEGNCPPNLFVSAAMGALAGVIFLLLAGFVFAKKRHSAKKDPKGVQSKQEVTELSEEVGYSAVHFKPHPSRSAGGQEEETVYSQVVR